MKIKMLILDVDGTLTDGKIYMGNDGEIMKAFHVKDGVAIKGMLPKYGILPVIITGRQSKIVENRCRELDIEHIFQNVTDKKKEAQKFLDSLGWTWEEVAYIGDDLNDIDTMRLCAVKGCPADAVDEVKELVDYICNKNGGEGAVREFVENLIKM